MVAAADGVVTADAKVVFERALAIDSAALPRKSIAAWQPSRTDYRMRLRKSGGTS